MKKIFINALVNIFIIVFHFQANAANIVFNVTGSFAGFGDVVGVVGNLIGIKKYLKSK